MKLSDLKPKSVTFTACGVTLTFRPFLISDDLNHQDLIGSAEELTEALRTFDLDKLLLLAWYQLDIKSQREVLSRVEDNFIHPETGEEVDLKLTPIQKFRQLFSGVADQQKLVENLLNCRGLNMPSLDDADAVKKWADQLKNMLPQTGP